jgi:predicted amidohydrolase YtcJ
MKLKDDRTKVLDYGTNSIYPGFLEAHCHPGFAGNIMFGRANLAEGKTPEDYLKILKEYVDNNKDKENIVGSGWADDLLYDLNAKQLDEICPDKPMINQSSSGHMMWVNTRAMEAFDINEDAVKQWGTECIHVDENGKPNGVLAEKPAIDLVKRVQPDLAQAKKELLGFQQYAFARIVDGRDEMLRVRSFMLHAPAVPLTECMIRPVPAIFFKERDTVGKVPVCPSAHAMAENSPT